MVAQRVGWIGLGRMGESMVARLLKAGHEVLVWNRTASKADQLKELGAKPVDNKQDLVDCDAVFTMISTTTDLNEVLFGSGGLAVGKKLPKAVIDCSSISQEGSAEIRKQLENRGISYLCAPVSGNAKVLQGRKVIGSRFGAKIAI